MLQAFDCVPMLCVLRLDFDRGIIDFVTEKLHDAGKVHDE